MDSAQWDIQEVKHLKKIQLVQYNIGMLVFFALLVYLGDNGKHFLATGVFYVLLWALVAITLYNMNTERPIGTKTSKRVQEFDRDHAGEKRWRRKKIIEAVFVSIIGIGVTIFLFIMDFNTAMLNSPGSYYPFIGAWIGFNIGEIFRMSNL